MTAAEEERLRRKAAWEAAQARALYEEMVLKKPKPTLVQLGAPGNGNGNGDAKPVTIQPAPAPAEPVGAHGDD
jgi:hypothetical protein